MKILISHYGIFKKGGWGRTFSLAKGLVDLGNDVTLLTTWPKKSLLIKRQNIDGVKVIIFPDIIPNMFTSKGFGLTSLLLKIIYVTFNKFEIVHSDEGHRPLSGVPCRLNKKIYNSIYVAEWWDLFGKGGEYDNKSFLFKLFLGRYELKYEIKDKKYADGIVVLSEYLKQKAQKINNKKNIIKIHGGADIDKIEYIFDNRLIKIKYGISKDCLTFGIIEALDPVWTEMKPFVECLTALKNQMNFKLLVYGGKITDTVKKNLKIEDMLHEFGWTDYSFESEKLACTDIFVMIKSDNLIYNAGWPNSLGDAMACGRPILINPVGETNDFVKKYPHGFFITKADKYSIKNSIIRILSERENLFNLGRINREIAENEISWKNKSEALYSFYKKIKTL